MEHTVSSNSVAMSIHSKDMITFNFGGAPPTCANNVYEPDLGHLAQVACCVMPWSELGTGHSFTRDYQQPS